MKPQTRPRSRRRYSVVFAYVLLVVVMTWVFSIEHGVIVGQRAEQDRIKQQSQVNCDAISAMSDWVTVLAKTSVHLFSFKGDESLRMQRNKADATYLSKLARIQSASACTELKKKK